MNHRQERINDSVAHELGEIIREVKDPRVTGAFTTINAAEVSRDLKFAKIYFGVICGSPEEVQEGLKSAGAFLRRELARRLNLRVTPELIFVHDKSAERGAHIASVLKELQKKEEKRAESAEGEENPEEM